MGLRDLANQAMRSEHTNLACRACALPFQVAGSGLAGSVQQGTQVAVTEAIYGEFASVHGHQEPAVVGTERLQGADAASLQFGRLAKFADQFPQRVSASSAGFHSCNSCDSWLFFFGRDSVAPRSLRLTFVLATAI